MADIPMVKIIQSVAILIDGNNIERSLHSMTKDENCMINFDNLIPKLLKGRGLSRLIYFREGNQISSKLADRLLTNYMGSVVPCHKSADIPLSISATQIARKVDTIIILSGDSDYVELVRHLKGEGVRIEIAAVKATTAQILIDEADHFVEINEEDSFSLVPKRGSTNKRTTSTKSRAPSNRKPSNPKPNPIKTENNKVKPEVKRSVENPPKHTDNKSKIETAKHPKNKRAESVVTTNDKNKKPKPVRNKAAKVVAKPRNPKSTNANNADKGTKRSPNKSRKTAQTNNKKKPTGQESIDDFSY